MMPAPVRDFHRTVAYGTVSYMLLMAYLSPSRHLHAIGRRSYATAMVRS